MLTTLLISEERKDALVKQVFGTKDEPGQLFVEDIYIRAEIEVHYHAAINRKSFAATPDVFEMECLPLGTVIEDCRLVYYFSNISDGAISDAF